MRRVVGLLLMGLLLASCSKQAPSVQPDAAPALPVATTAQPGQAYGPGGGAPMAPPGPIEADLPVPSSLPEGMRRVELAAGQSITEPGLYYMDVATGKLEGWLMPPWDQHKQMRWAQTTPDHGWITFGMAGQGYLIRRSDGQVFRYDSERLWVTPGPGVFLVQQPYWSGTARGKMALVDGEMKLVSTFALDPGMPGNVQFLFSPNGKTLAAAEGSDGGGLSLVDVATGRVTKLAGPWGDGSVRFLTLPALGEFVVIHGNYQQPMWLERYNWQGGLVGRKQVTGWEASISPDGRMLAVTQSMGHDGQATMMQEWGSEKPLLRVAGGLGPAWLAGGTELVVETSRGWQLVSKTGDMRPVPLAGPAQWRPFEWYLPSSDRPDLFLTGAKVVDRSGRTVHSTQLAAGAQARLLSGGWGPSSREVQLVVIPPLHKGFEREPSSHFLPRVQRPPFPDKYPLKVEDPKGECLNLRAEPSITGRVIRCLPTGSRLALVVSPEGDLSSNWVDQMLWLRVETEKGEKGSVAINFGSITYAD